jgi:hypothetical protein
MRRAFTLLVLIGVLGLPQWSAAEPPRDASLGLATGGARLSLHGLPLRDAIESEGARLASSLAGRSNGVLQPSQRGDKGWIGRHPALFGALVGAAGGAVAAATMENELFCSGGDEDCFFHGNGRVLVGAGMGAGIGSLVGLLAGRSGK